MNAKRAQPNEQKLITLYMETTGASEALARSVLMLLDLPDGRAPHAFTRPNATQNASLEQTEDPSS